MLRDRRILQPKDILQKAQALSSAIKQTRNRAWVRTTRAPFLECLSWERGHLCLRNAVRPLFVFRKRIADKDACAPGRCRVTAVIEMRLPAVLKPESAHGFGVAWAASP
jgi:hypothetical protein